MCSNSETTSNSTKLRPLRWAELMPEILALQTDDSPDSSFSGLDESSDSSQCDPTAISVKYDSHKKGKENKDNSVKNTQETKCDNVSKELNSCQKALGGARSLTPTLKVGLKRYVPNGTRRGTPAKERPLRETARCIFPNTPNNGEAYRPSPKQRFNTPKSHNKLMGISTSHFQSHGKRIQNIQSDIDSLQVQPITGGDAPQVDTVREHGSVRCDLNPLLEQEITQKNISNPINPIRYEEHTPRNTGVQQQYIGRETYSQNYPTIKLQTATPQFDESNSKRDALRRHLYHFNSNLEHSTPKVQQSHINVTNQQNSRLLEASTPQVKPETHMHNNVHNYPTSKVEETPQVSQSRPDTLQVNKEKDESNVLNSKFEPSATLEHPQARQNVNLRAESNAKTEPSGRRKEHVDIESGCTEPSEMKTKPLGSRTEPSGTKTEPLGNKPESLGPPETPVLARVRSALPAYPTPSQPAVPQNTQRSFNTITIKGKNYLKIKKLGEGGSCKVYKVLDVNTSAEFAVKCVSLAVGKELREGYLNEIRLLRELQGSNRVVTMHDFEYCRSPQMLLVVLEIGETDLASLLRSHSASTRHLPLPLILFYWTEMLAAVDHIHQHGVVHADLKPANFLLVCGRLKLIDFGIASRIATDATSAVRSSAAGTFNYISPEALAGGAGGRATEPGGNAPIKITFRSDVWSLGCILYSMIYGKTPFAHLSSAYSKIAAIVDPHHTITYPPPPLHQMPSVLMQALRWCLTYNSKKRPSVQELMALPYVGGAQAPPALLRRVRGALPTQDWQELKETFGIIEPDDL